MLILRSDRWKGINIVSKHQPLRSCKTNHKSSLPSPPMCSYFIVSQPIPNEPGQVVLPSGLTRE